jgi:hypothetical protein
MADLAAKPRIPKRLAYIALPPYIRANPYILRRAEGVL